MFISYVFVGHNFCTTEEFEFQRLEEIWHVEYVQSSGKRYAR